MGRLGRRIRMFMHMFVVATTAGRRHGHFNLDFGRVYSILPKNGTSLRTVRGWNPYDIRYGTGTLLTVRICLCQVNSYEFRITRIYTKGIRLEQQSVLLLVVASVDKPWCWVVLDAWLDWPRSATKEARCTGSAARRVN